MVSPRSQPPLHDPVTNHMRRDFVRIPAGHTVGQAIEYVRSHPTEGRIIYFYVVDDEGRLIGVLPTRRLLFSPPETPVADIMVHRVIAIPASATVLEACEFFTLHELLAFPVVDDAGRILGIVDVELYTEELTEVGASERASDVFQLIGVHLTEAQQANPLLAFRKRFAWLVCNIGGGILAALLAWFYEPVLEQAVALSLFIPVVLALAESVSIQSVSLALLTLHVRPPTWAALGRRASRELVVGLLLGAASGLLVALVSLVWLQQLRVAWCILGGILGGVAGAALIGLSMPFLLRLLQRDPQVAAGPVALASADMLTLLVYFNLGYWLLL